MNGSSRQRPSFKNAVMVVRCMLARSTAACNSQPGLRAQLIQISLMGIAPRARNVQNVFESSIVTTAQASKHNDSMAKPTFSTIMQRSHYNEVTIRGTPSHHNSDGDHCVRSGSLRSARGSLSSTRGSVSSTCGSLRPARCSHMRGALSSSMGLLPSCVLVVVRMV